MGFRFANFRKKRLKDIIDKEPDFNKVDFEMEEGLMARPSTRMHDSPLP